MKLRNKKSFLCLALLGLGLGTISGCGSNAGAITFELNDKAATSGNCFVGVTYTLTAKIELEKPVFSFTTDAVTAFTFNKVSDNSIQFTPRKTGNYVIFAKLEGEAETTAQFNVSITKGEETYRLEADTSGMDSDVFKQGEPFNSQGLVVYKRAYIDGLKGERYATDEFDLSIEDGEILDIAGEIEVTVTSREERVEPTSFTITVSDNPSFLADKFFKKLGNNFSTFQVARQDEAYVSMVRNENYILSYENGYGFFVDQKDEYKSIRTVTMTPSEDGKSIVYNAGRQLFIDGFIDSQTLGRGTTAALEVGGSLLGLASGEDYESSMFSNATVGKLSDGTLTFTLPANSQGALYLLSLIGYQEYTNYGFKMTPTCYFIESDEFGEGCFIEVQATMPGQQPINMLYLIAGLGFSGDEEFDKYLQTDYTVNESYYEPFNNAAKMITDCNFVASDYGTFEEKPNKDGMYSVFTATETSYMSSFYYGNQYQKIGVFEMPEGKTKPAGYYELSSRTKDGDPTVTQLTGDNAGVYNLFLPKNWMGFVDADNSTNDWAGQNTLDQWYFEGAFPNSKDNTTTYSYKFVGFYSAIKWYYQATFQDMQQYFAAESISLSVVLNNADNSIQGLSMMLRGETTKEGAAQFGPTNGVCNLGAYEIDTTSVGKTTNAYLDRYLESITKVQQ